MVGPVQLNQDVRNLPYVAPKPKFEEKILTPHTYTTGQPGAQPDYRISGLAYVQATAQKSLAPDPDHAWAAADI